MKDLQSKHYGIQFIIEVIRSHWGENFFSFVDFWEADNCAVGLKRANKLIYISTWEFRDLRVESFKCYCELEVINESSLETIAIRGRYEGIDRVELLDLIARFVDE